MLDRLDERLGLPDGSFAPIGVEALVGRPIPDAAAALPSSTSRPGSRSGATRSAGSPWRSGSSCPTSRTRSTSPIGSSRGDDAGGRYPGPERPVQLILRPLVHFRSHDAPVNSPHPGPYRFTASADRYEISSGRRHPAAADDPGRPRPGVHPRRRADDADHLPAGGPARLRIHGRPVEPRVLPGRADAGRAHHADRLGRVVGDPARPHARGGPAGRARAARAAGQRGPPRGQGRPRSRRLAGRGRPGSRPSWCWPPTSSSSPPTAASRTPPGPTPPATRCAP